MTQVTYPQVPAPAFPGPPVASLPYATPAAPRVGPRALAGGLILLAAVALVGLGGCFLMGVMALVAPKALFGGSSYPPAPPAPLTGEQLGFMFVLYLMAFASFGGAAVLLFLGTRGLLRVLRGSTS